MCNYTYYSICNAYSGDTIQEEWKVGNYLSFPLGPPATQKLCRHITCKLALNIHMYSFSSFMPSADSDSLFF